MKTKPNFRRPATIGARGTGAALVLLALGLAISTIGCTPAAETEIKKSPPDNSRADESRTEEFRGDDDVPLERPSHKTKASADMPSHEESNRVARLFGESLLAGNFPAAYELTSHRLQHRLSLKKFSEACQQAVEQYGPAVQLGKVVTDRTDGLAGSAASQQYGFPNEIPDDDRLAWVHSALALDVDGEEILRCYDCWMLVENDAGKPRIGHFAFTTCE